MKTLFIITIAALALPACEKKQNDDPVVTSLPPTVLSQKSPNALLVVKTELRSDGLLVQISGVPAGSTVECDLDLKPLTPCHDGAVFPRPAAGDHRVHAAAMKAGQKVALGDSATFTVAPLDATDTSADAGKNLALLVDDVNFRNGMTVPMTADFVARFKLAQPAACATKLRCSYDRPNNPFWTDCDTGANTFTINKDLLASGLQYVSAQASCGDQLGPILTVFFYGVPANYEPLMLRAIKDSTGRRIVNLVKADDCPESQQKFECSEDAFDPFTRCVNGNVVDAPGTAFRMRLVCDNRTGPALNLGN